MNRLIAWGLGALAILLAAASPAQQQKAPPSPLETRLEARKVTLAADGKETFAPAEAARPGDVIEYVATYRNTGKQSLANLVATLPIPANTEFIPDSARPAGAKASVDGTAFADMPLMRRVKRDGKDIEERVPVREYRSLRWSSGALGGDTAVQFTARVRVVDDRPPSEPGRQGGGK